MTQEKRTVPWITHIRRDVLHIHPKSLVLGILQFFAMNCPFFRLRPVFHRLRGAKIDKNVAIGPLVFFDEIYPELIIIKEGADIGPRVVILTHDSILYHLHPPVRVARTKEVFIGRNCYIGADTTILPGVTIGDDSIIGAGSVVTKSVPPAHVAMGVPAKIICSREEWDRKYRVNE